MNDVDAGPHVGLIMIVEEGASRTTTTLLVRSLHTV